MAEQLRQPDKTEKLEILDLENHRGLYGRLLMASLPGAKIANIIDPAKKVEFNDLTADTLDKRNYNPVFQNLSHAERQDQWKDFKPSAVYKTAYDQWRAEFTDCMVNIQDPQRALALKAIISNKESKNFTVTDADSLFKEFCDGKSDINNFLKKITANLVSDGKIKPANLQALLLHLQWIASGLFGKNTAIMANPLIELESAIQNDSKQFIEIFNSNRERINTPGEDEKKILGLLRDSFIVPQESKPVTAADAPKPPPVIAEPDKDEDNNEPPAAPVKTSLNSQVAQNQGVVPPVLEKELNELLSGVTSPEELFKLLSGMTDEKLIGVDKIIEEKLLTFVRLKADFEQTKKKYEELQKANRTAEQLAKYWQVGEDMKELEKNIARYDEEITQLRLAMARARERDRAHPATAPESAPRPAPPIEAKSNIVKIGENKIKEIKVEGVQDGLMSLEINEKDTGLHWYKREVEGKTYYILGPQAILSGEWENLPEYLDLPEGLAAKFYIHHYVANDNQNRYMGIMGGKDVKIGLKGDFYFDLSIFPKDYFVAQGGNLVGEWPEKSKDKEGRAIETDASGNFLSRWVEAKDVLRHLEKSFQILDQSLSPKAPNLTAEAPIGNVQGLVQSPAARGGEVLLSETSSRENPNVVNLESKGALLVEELNERLRQSDNFFETFSAPVTIFLREFNVMALADGIEVENPGKLEVKNNQIHVTGLRLKKRVLTKSFRGTLNLTISNSQNGGIQAEGEISTESNKFREAAEKGIRDINSNIIRKLNKEISRANPNWTSGTVSIAGDRVLIEFSRREGGILIAG